MTTTKHQKYPHLGPSLLDALLGALLQEINLLREQHNLSPTTKKDILQYLKNQKVPLPDYNWTKD